MTLPKAVFLDVGWTLIYPHRSLWDVLAEVAREAGAQLSSETAEHLVHTAMTRHREHAVNEFRAGAEYSDSDEQFEGLFLSMGHLVFGQADVKGDYDKLTRESVDRFWSLDNWAIFSDVIRMMESLRARSIRVGALSNASSALVGFLEHIGLLPYFDVVVVSAIEGTRKPDRRIFERALERAGVFASEAVHVGDMYLEDVLGPRNAGMRPFLIDRQQHSMFPNHPETHHHLSEKIEVVQGLDEVLSAIGMD